MSEPISPFLKHLHELRQNMRDGANNPIYSTLTAPSVLSELLMLLIAREEEIAHERNV